MKKLVLSAFLCASLVTAAMPSLAQDFAGFGIDDPELSLEFWNEAQEIANSSGAVRGEGDENGSATVPVDTTEMLQRAYRADPEATLALIERMLSAGQAD